MVEAVGKGGKSGMAAATLFKRWLLSLVLTAAAAAAGGDGPPSCACETELVDVAGGRGSAVGAAEGPIFGNSVRTGDRVLPFCNKQLIRSNVMCRFFPCTGTRYIVDNLGSST